MKFTIGADPELFLADAASSLVSVVDKIGGTKQQPLPLPMGDGFAVQEDNVAVEFNIPPANSSQEFQKSLSDVMSFLAKFFKEQHNLQFINLSAASFPKEQLDHWKAQEFGCDPDFNAWTKAQNPRPRINDKSLRSAGGHIHVGFPFNGLADQINLIKCMDLFLGIPSVLMDQGLLRKQLYGKAGAHRIKPYGAEYRVLSNYWVFKPELMDWVYRNTQRALDALPNIEQIAADEDYIVPAINHNDQTLANYLVDRYNLEVLYA